MYTNSVDIRSTSRETNVIPLIFVLLPNKTKIIYTRLFELIKQYISNYDPNIITNDFETIFKLLMIFFSNRYSNYHFYEYKNDEEICPCIRICSSLALIPLKHIKQRFDNNDGKQSK